MGETDVASGKIFVFSGDNARGTFSVSVCESTKLLCVAYFLCIVFCMMQF